MVPRHNGFHGLTLPATRFTTQVRLVTLTLFNVVVDNVIRTWLAVTVEDQRVDNDGLGDTAGRCLGVFYADDGMVGSRYPDWMKHSMNILICLFQTYGLPANISKSGTMLCQPGIQRLGVSEGAKSLKCTRVEDSYRVRLRRRIPCPEWSCSISIWEYRFPFYGLSIYVHIY